MFNRLLLFFESGALRSEESNEQKLNARIANLKKNMCFCMCRTIFRIIQSYVLIKNRITVDEAKSINAKDFRRDRVSSLSLSLVTSLSSSSSSSSPSPSSSSSSECARLTEVISVAFADEIGAVEI